MSHLSEKQPSKEESPGSSPEELYSETCIICRGSNSGDDGSVENQLR